jgi:hypothetical protein
MGAVLLTLVVGSAARADKLIHIPTADISRLSAEYMTEVDDDLDVITAQIGFAQFELLGRRYLDWPGRGDSTEVGGQLQILPEGFATPGLSLGIWDVASDTPRGRRVFLVISKSLSVVNWLPLWFKDIKVHGGLGTSGLSGVFAGAQASIPFGMTLVAEFDSSRTNFGLWWSPVKPLRVKAESWGGDFVVGAQFVSPL